MGMKGAWGGWGPTVTAVFELLWVCVFDVFHAGHVIGAWGLATKVCPYIQSVSRDSCYNSNNRPTPYRPQSQTPGRLTKVAILPQEVPPISLLLAYHPIRQDLLAVMLLAVDHVDLLPADRHLADVLSARPALAALLAVPASPVPPVIRPAAVEHHVPHIRRTLGGWVGRPASLVFSNTGGGGSGLYRIALRVPAGEVFLLNTGLGMI